MMTSMSKLIIANWKMNPPTLAEARTLLSVIKKTALVVRNVTTVIAPPTVFLQPLAVSSRAKRLQFGVQNMHFATMGPQVGEVSATQVREVGASYVLIGHSARRELGETDKEVTKKVSAALAAKLTPVVFVGERERDAHGNFLRVIRKQVKDAFTETPRSRIKDVILVYEPVWAISTASPRLRSAGTNGGITTNEIHQMTLFVRKVLTESFGIAMARKIKILYGGSVNANNAEEVLGVPGIEGAAVGGASLDAKEFGVILRAANKA